MAKMHRSTVKPRIVVPIFTPKEITEIPGPAAPPVKLTYRGGHLLTAVEIIPIFWGAAWQQEPQRSIGSNVKRFLDYIVTSSLIDALSEYSVPRQVIGRGRVRGEFEITTSEPGHVTGGGREVNDTEVQQALQKWITQGLVPRPNSNTLYFVYLPPGVLPIGPNGERTCQQMCGYHFYKDPSMYYGVIPFPSCDKCLIGNKVIDTLTIVSSHELCEAITDPTPGKGWYNDAKGEIGDICESALYKVAGYAIQGEWSNTAQACIIRRPPPVGHMFNAFQTVPNDGFNDWSILGQDTTPEALGQIAVISGGSGALEVFAVSNDTGEVVTIFQDGPNGNFEGWVSIGGPPDGVNQVAVGKNADNRLEVFASDRGNNGYVWHTVQPTPSSGFGDWSTVSDQKGLGQISVISRGNGALEVFAVSNDTGEVVTIFQDGPNGNFEGWVNMGGPPDGVNQVAVGKNADNRLEVFASENKTGQVWHTAQQPTSSSGFGDWSILGQDTAPGGLGQIAVISGGSGALEVFAVSNDTGEVVTIFQDGPNGNFEGWVSIGGSHDGVNQVAVGKNADNRLEVFARDRGNDGYVWHTVQPTPSSGFGDWSTLGDQKGLGQIAIGSNADGKLGVFAVYEWSS